MKKPTNRIRQNGSTKAVKSQAKTAAQENVTIVVTCKETGELAAKFDVPRSFHDAMVSDALAKGIGLQQWIEKAVRERIRGADVCECLAAIENAKNEAIHLLERIDAGVLNTMVEEIISSLESSVENAFAALRGEPATK
jgi:hypothetical protein